MLIFVGFLDGFLNAIAGVGSFITLPTLIVLRLNPITTIATVPVAIAARIHFECYGPVCQKSLKTASA